MHHYIHNPLVSLLSVYSMFLLQVLFCTCRVFVDLETCIDLYLYIFPLVLTFFLKSSTNINLKIKRDNELQKLSHILVFD